MIESVKIYRKELSPKDFTEKQLSRIDIKNLGRTFVQIKIKSIDDKYFDAMKMLNKLQYKLPMKYLKPVKEVCSYISQKSQLTGSEKDIKNASVTIEPLNGDLFNMVIPHTPINQYLPLGTVVNLNVDIPFTNPDGTSPERKFIWSSNLKTEPKIADILKKENSHSITLDPWLQKVHYGTVDIGSQITGKFIVTEINPDIQQSYSLFGFYRSDEKKIYEMWIYDYYNLSIKDLLKLILDYSKTRSSSHKNLIEFIEELTSKI